MLNVKPYSINQLKYEEVHSQPNINIQFLFMFDKQNSYYNTVQVHSQRLHILAFWQFSKKKNKKE